MKIFAAPLQGLTEAPWRIAHAALPGGVDEYFAPFSRVEKGAVRRRDLIDYNADAHSTDHIVTPQAIFRDADELRIIIDSLVDAGARSIDLNMGCPFPPQVKKGRGAGIIGRVDELEKVAKLIAAIPEIAFSVKMRLGVHSHDEWRESIDVVNDMPLRHVTLHPRTAKMQYSGALLYDQFGDFTESCCHPLIFNGDLLTLEDIETTINRFPSISGVMLGRGLLGRPLLAAEFRSAMQIPDEQQLKMLLLIHDAMLETYSKNLTGGAHQVLQKIKPFWTYATELIPRHIAKAIHKSSSLEKYLTAVNTLR